MVIMSIAIDIINTNEAEPLPWRRGHGGGREDAEEGID
jgi:hypothetical protein